MASGDVIGPLVSCEWLHQKLTGGDSGKIVLIDVTWSSEKDCLEEFKQRHIPQARHINILAGPHTKDFPRNLSPLDDFQENARAAGINQDSHVILYSDSDNFGFFLSGRAWWTFVVSGFPREQISILNGGMQRWRHLGYPVTDQLVPVQRGNFVASDKSQDYRLTLEALEGLKAGDSDVLLLDTRSPALFNDGHVPGADNLFYSRLVDQDKMELKPVDDLKKEFSAVLKSSGGLQSTPLVTYCNSGMSSSTVLFAAMLCGIPHFRLFHGGFNEWKNKRPDRIEKSSA